MHEDIEPSMVFKMHEGQPYPASLCLGVLGGMGPLAGAAFVNRLVQLTPASRDQEHLPVILRNDPRIPDRSNAKMQNGGDPFPAMKTGVEALEKMGVSCIAIPCNTAHLWYEELAQSVSVPVLHIVESVVHDLHRQGLREGRIGIMGTPATLASGLYQKYLEQAGFEPVVPNQSVIDECCVAAISAVKANRTADAFLPTAKGVQALQQQGVVGVVLGCTELPLAIPHERRREFNVVLTDSIDALVLEVLDWFDDAELFYSL